MKALRFDGRLQLSQDAPVKQLEGEALVEVLYAGICNTDLEIVKGYAGFQGILGHEFVGRVVEAEESSWVGSRVVGEINVGCNQCSLCLSGDARHCLKRTVLGIKQRDGAFAEYLSLPIRNLRPIPAAIANEDAVFIEPLAAACQILAQVKIHPGMTVAVIGDGKLAQLIVRALASTKCDLTIIGKHQNKLDLMSGLAGQVIQFTANENSLQEIFRQLGNSRFDLVIEASGSFSGLPMAIPLVKPCGAIVLKSTYNGSSSLDLTQVAVNEIQIIGSRCGRFDSAIELLANNRIEVRSLISDMIELDEGLHAFEAATAPQSLKVLLRMPAAS
ncbi:MAG: alcohol dehydrogenase catalytic domain-containing protein [Acidobacteria bacterium]|nr:alcohol dehydrogenase catalytic domain-containing protein [Acidobacteriota bacterium]